MKKALNILSFTFAFVFASIVFAQDVLPVPIPEVTTTQFFELLLKFIGGMKGASTVAIVAGVVQLLFALLGTGLLGNTWKNLKPQVKFIIVGVLSIASMTTTLMIASNLPLAAALLHSTVVMSLMNYGYKFYELYIEEKK